MPEDPAPGLPPPEAPVSPWDFAELYRRTLTPLRRYLTRLLGNPGEAQDVAQDAYVRVYPAMQRRTATQPAGLLYLTARRLAINRLKHRGVAAAAQQQLGLAEEDAAPAGVAQQVVLREELALLSEAVAQLPERCRAVLLLRSLELRSHREIAERLGIAVSTVEKQHARALRLLRAALAAATGAAPARSARAPSLADPSPTLHCPNPSPRAGAQP